MRPFSQYRPRADLANVIAIGQGYRFQTGDGRLFRSQTEAEQHRTDVYNASGVVIAIEAIRNDSPRR